MKNTFPMKLVIEFESTNGTTMREAVQHVEDMLKRYKFPKTEEKYIDEKFKTSYWEIKILKSEINGEIH